MGFPDGFDMLAYYIVSGIGLWAILFYFLVIWELWIDRDRLTDAFLFSRFECPEAKGLKDKFLLVELDYYGYSLYLFLWGYSLFRK